MTGLTFLAAAAAALSGTMENGRDEAGSSIAYLQENNIKLIISSKSSLKKTPTQ